MIPAFRRTPYDREIIRIGLPALGALAADPLVSLIDTAFVGRLGATALASVAIASAIFLAVFAIFNFLGYAVTPLVAQSIGAGDRTEAGRFTVAALAISAVAGVVAAVALVVLGEPLLRAFGTESDVLEGAATYLRIRALGVPSLLVILVGHGAFRGYQDTRTPLVVTLGLNAVNLVLDPILIFGLGWGIAGAAWATVTAQWFGAIWFVALFFWTRRVEMGIGFGWPQRRALGPLFSAGKAMVLRNASLLVALTAATMVAARLGTAAVAAHQIAIQLWIFLALVMDALAIAGQAIVGKEIGAGNRAIAREVSNRLLALGFLFGIVLATVLGVTSPWLASWFTVDEAVVMAFASILPILIVMQPINSFAFVWDGIAIGAAAFGFLAGSTLAAGVAAVGFLLAVIPLGLGLVGVWAAIVVLMLVRVTSLWWWYSNRFARNGPDPSPSSREA
ncbi:MAG: MATE family efflux transporter [Actinomycetota bacterium]|nr:MATE family efflux transporter [Actinomycetota bacterium]